MEDLYNSQLPVNYGNHHRASSVLLEKEQLEKFNEISACYDKYESILGQVKYCFHQSTSIVSHAHRSNQLELCQQSLER